MTRILSACLASLFLLALLIASAARADNLTLDQHEQALIDSGEPITLAAMYDFVPFSFIEDGQHKGFVADLTKLLEQKTGMRIDVHTGEWSNNLRMLREQQIDVIADISFKPERTPYTLYTTPYFEIPTVVFTQKHFGEYKSLADLSGKRVGVLQNIFYLPELRSNNDIDVIEFDDYERLVRALAFGEVDAAIQNLTSGYHYASRNAYTNIKVAGEFQLRNVGREDLRFGVRVDRPEIRSLLQKGMDAITDSEWDKLIDLWVGSESLGFIRNARTVALTPEEREFVKQMPVIRVHNEKNFEPYSFYEDGKPRGHSVDLVRLLAERAGLQVEFVSGKRWDDYLQMIRSGELDVMTNIVRSPEREQYMHFTTPYLRLAQALYQHSDSRPINTLEELKGKSLVLHDGFFLYEQFSRVPGVNLLASSDSLESLMMVSTGQADATIELMSVADHLSQKYGVPNLKTLSTLNIKGGEPLSLHLAVRKDLPLLRDILQKAMNSLTEKEKRELQQEWIARTNNPTHYVHLTGQELAWLESRAALRICVQRHRMPYEQITEDGRHVGAFADMLEKIRNHSGLSFRLVPVDNYATALSALQQGHCDLISKSSLLPEQQSLSFTQPLFNTSLVIATRLDEVFVSSAEQLEQKTIGVVMNDDPHLWLQQSYPELQLHTYPDLPTALNALSEGDIFAVADTLPAMARGLGQNFFANLKISGQIEPNYTARFAMRAEDATLNQIMNKALMSVTDDQRESIGNRWMTAPTYAERTDYTLVGQITLATAFALVLILLWNRKLSRLNNTIRENNLQLLDAHEELKLKNRMLEQLSVTDRLTRLKNRLYIERIFDQEIARAEQGGQYDFAVLLLDIDHFKRINDHFGHAAGDATLTDFATILRGNCREHDVIARWGGEEFMVICPNTNAESAETLAQSLCRAIREHNFPLIGHCTTSIGVTVWRPGDRQKSMSIRADTALYAAKESGRDRVCHEF